MLLVPVGQYLLGNLLIKKGVIKPGKGNVKNGGKIHRVGQSILSCTILFIDNFLNSNLFRPQL